MSTSSSAASAGVEVTVTESRLPKTPLALVVFLVYFPLGCCLALVRFLLSFQIFIFTTIWPICRFRNYMLRTMCSYLLGIWVKEENNSSFPTPPSPRVGSIRPRHHLNRSPSDDMSDGAQVGVDAATSAAVPDTPAEAGGNSTPIDESSPKLFVANSVSVIDGAVVALLFPRTRVINTIKLPRPLSWLLGYERLSGRGTNGTISALEQLLSSRGDNVLVFPERCLTNGKAVLKLDEKLVWCETKKREDAGDDGKYDPRSLIARIHPLVIRFRRFPVDFPATVLGSTELADLFWMLWAPVNLITVQTLCPTAPRVGETPASLAARVQSLIADALGVPALAHNDIELREYAKRRLRDVQYEDVVAMVPGMAGHRRERRQDRASRELVIDTMVAQIKTVLPQVPVALIRRDVKQTRDVDVTITRFLEGTIPYEPEDTTSPSRDDEHKTNDTDAASSLSELIEARPGTSDKLAPDGAVAKPRPSELAATEFASTSRNRQLSFADRKKFMIEQSRERYLKRMKLKTA